MEHKIMVTFLWILFGVATAIEIELSSSWKKDFGWEVTCNWELFSNDSLQSVRLYHNDRQFMIYRPEKDGTQRYQKSKPPENVMEVNCAETQERGVRGQCVITVELYQPQKQDISFSCEVSKERPHFLIKKTNIIIDAFVLPTDAVIEMTSKTVNNNINSSDQEQSGRVVLNCTSSGMPTPSLVWTIGERKVPHDFTDSHWNMTSKLWHVWSQMSYTPSEEHPSAICTPEVSKVVKGESVKQQLERGKPAEFLYNSASSIDVRKIYLIFMSLLLLR